MDFSQNLRGGSAAIGSMIFGCCQTRCWLPIAGRSLVRHHNPAHPRSAQHPRRKLKFTKHQQQEVIARREAGEALAEIGRSYNVSTISRLANAITREHV